MSDTVIKVENLSKEYRLGTISHGMLYRDIQSWWAKLRGKEDPNSFVHLHSSHQVGPKSDRFLALDDVSFEIKQGDIVGIIGRNGAGKSTLLKILSRVTSPTSGEVKIKGRVASLLEVGTGFHPELTGRENIFLNGAILGMSKAEIRRKLDEIIAFAEIEKFIDTPVKRYSSGMYVRLAFAVAAHLEPEILIVDEVLAVGDAQFQKKCLGKMQEVGKEGRTVLFVSHNMASVSNLCSRCVLLNAGRVAQEGAQQDVITSYCEGLSSIESGQADLTNVTERFGRREFSKLISIAFLDADGEPTNNIPMGASITIRLGVIFSSAFREPEVGVVISTISGQRIVRFVSVWEGLCNNVLPGEYHYDVKISTLPLVPGVYTLTPWIKQRRGESDDLVEGALKFTVGLSDVNGYAPYFDLYCQPGEFYQQSVWSMNRVGS